MDEWIGVDHCTIGVQYSDITMTPQAQDLPVSLWDEESEGVRTPLLHTANEQRESIRTTSTVISGEDGNDDVQSGHFAETSSTPESASVHSLQMPIPLLLLFGLYGLTLSLPTLPLMYILNTRVALPLSMLPTYGALSFLPFSFKPLYGYWSSFFPRQTILALGWGCCALTSVGWTWVFSTPSVFVMGISNGVAMAWSGFLLGLTLLDQATRQQILHVNSDNSSFEKAASLFQSQAATARNVGSFLGSIMACIVFGMSHSTSKMNDAVTNALLLTTAACHVISCLVSMTCPDTFASISPMEANALGGDEHQQLPQQQHPEESSYNYLNRRHPSYDTMDDYLAGSDGESEDHSEGAPETESIASNTSLLSPLSMIPFNKNVILIGALQISVIVLALKKPLLDWLSHHRNLVPILGGAALLAAVLIAVHFYYSSSTTSPWKLSHMVGLALMLRHAIPNTSSILTAFLYYCLRNQPVWLQVFSLVDNGVVTAASWSYQKLWASHYSHGRKLIHFMMVTTIVASLAQYLHVFLVKYYKHDFEASMDEYSSLHTIFPWFVLAVKIVDAFFGEWNFLPDVVLATTSVSMPGVEPAVSSPESDMHDEEAQGLPSQAAVPVTVTTPVVASAAAGVEYGSLISCIDFGDQLGTIMATPLVSILGITRENGWNHLDLMIQICVLLSVLSVGVLAPLLWWFPTGAPPTRNNNHQQQ